MYTHYTLDKVRVPEGQYTTTCFWYKRVQVQNHDCLYKDEYKKVEAG